jgi:hypothetical protein
LTFPVVKLLDYVPREAELAASDNPFATVVLAHLQALATRNDLEARRHGKIQLVRNLYDRGWDAERVRQLFRFIDWLLELPPALGQLFKEDLNRLEEERRVPYITSIERMGYERGLEEGQRKGLEEGQRKILLPALELALRLKFGLSGKKLFEEIRPFTDLVLLQAIHQAIESAPTPEDLRRIWSLKQ